MSSAFDSGGGMSPDAAALPASAQILIVDAHELVGWSLAVSLSDAGEPARFLPARSAAQIPEIGRRDEPGLLVLELRLGQDASGQRVDNIDLIMAMVVDGWRVVVLTGDADPEGIGAALAAGAFGWLPKTLPFPALLTALRAARAGRPITSEHQRLELVACFRHRTLERERRRARLDSLTPREREVLSLLAEGRRARLIADHFTVSPATVRAQIRSVLAKLDVSSQLEAVALYGETGYCSG